jgi:Flp pilus assembly pilin Flp
LRTLGRDRGGVRDQGGVSVEFTLLVMFIAVTVIMAVALLGGAVDGLFRSTDEVPWDSGP